MKPTLGTRGFCGPDQANGDDEGTITESEADKFALPKLTSSHYFWLTPGGDRESQSAVKRRIFHAMYAGAPSVAPACKHREGA
jgi:hypothetical protein